MGLLRSNVVLALVAAEYRRRPGRLVLTTLATVAAACVVVWVVSSYDSLLVHFDKFSDEYLGRYQVIVVPARPKETTTFGPRQTPTLPISALDQIRSDTAVESLDSVLQARVRVALPPGNPGAARVKQDSLPMLAGSDAAAPPYPLLKGAWISPQRSAEGAISAACAAELGIEIGDALTISDFANGTKRTVTIVGIVEQLDRLPPMSLNAEMPSMRLEVLQYGPADAVLYVPLQVAREILGNDAPPSYGGIVLKPNVEPSEFMQRFAAEHRDFSQQAELQTAEQIDGELQSSFTSESARIQSYSATGLSLLAALFIIMSTLSMSVQERIRQFAMLRAIALKNWHIVAIVALEGALLGLIGWGGGLLAGWGLLQLMAWLRPALFPGGASLGSWCVLLSGACALGGAMLASLYPSWCAISATPLEGMIRRPAAAPAYRNARLGLLGAALIAFNPLVMFYAPIPASARYVTFAAIGCATTAIGFLLIAPLLFRVVERVASPLIAFLLRLNPQLLATQLTANLWRSLSVTLTLSVGLGLFVAMQTWGYSMLAPFMPGEWMPEALVMISHGATDAQLEALAGAGVVRDLLPLAIEQPKFAEDVTDAKTRATVTRQDNCVLAGVDVDRAFGGDHPLLNVRFVDGTREEAVAKLKSGRYCLVPDHFERQSGLGVGSQLELVPPADPERTVSYEIAGVVSLEGWHLASKGGLRTRSPRSAAMVFAPIGEVRRDFAIGDLRFLWASVDGSQTEATLGKALSAALNAPAQQVAATASGDAKPQRPIQARVQLTSTLRGIVQKHADAIIWGLSKLPLITLAVTSLGVASAVLSSVRSRRWELGVLRSIGMTRFALLRLILAETLLISLAACLLSLGFGVAVGYCGTEVTRYVDVHGGLNTTLVIPWLKIAPGMLAAALLSIAAALGPAVVASRCEPLRLLQDGRGVG
ncbi:ABC transporter permease [Lacipirellula parvula]|uniref:ABC3 transporter permease C-terminal domain-containing protein n=1 Tax=Lacipirellula parvula TaxID=2650471 RepID=A0A5K7X6U0_9BACT|nr:ABC transporter permease [Lacipirellula parvula]BBO32085.1 hypothetical protein PLANPX_1697 [Lacipirellula parvula]